MSEPLTLTTSRYVEPGNYIGEIINPESSNLSANARIPAIIAKGSRYAVAKNVPIRRAFIGAQALNFSATPPFVAPLLKQAQGIQALPNRIFLQDGTQLRIDQWKYLADNTGKYFSVQIKDEVFDPLASYLIDYQSVDRTVQDPIPVADIRQIRAVGNNVDRAQFQEYRDFYIPMSFTAVIPDPNNTNPAPFFSAITPTLQVGSTGGASLDVNAQYTGAYSRGYVLTCLSASGAPGSRVATFKWAATNLSGGNNQVPPVPLHSTDAFPQFTLTEATPASLTQTLEMGVVLDFNFGGTNFAAGDSFALTANGPSAVEVDSRYSNPQYATLQAPFVVSGTANNLGISVNSTALYTHKRNNNYRVKLLSISGSSPNRILNFVWARYGDVLGKDGAFTVLENTPASLTATLLDGVKLDFVIGVTSPAAGTQWDVIAQSPRFYYVAKDSREYKLTVAAPTTPALNVTELSGSFSTNTSEGRFGVFDTKWDSTGAITTDDGYALMADNVSFAFRNVASFAALDIFRFGVIDTDIIDWSLTATAQDLRQVTDFQVDMNGQITGTAGQVYVTLANIPTDPSAVQVRNANTNQAISFNLVLGKPYVYFTINPGAPVVISYPYRGLEPDPGQTYYMTLLFLRPLATYNVPFLVLRLDDGRNFAAPSTMDNDLYIGNEILWANNAVGTYLIQPYNLDGSGNYSLPDYTAAIQSVRPYDRITDLCLLNFPEALAVVLNENVLANDPFEKRPNMVWFGPAIGTPIGDQNTDGSMVQYAEVALQVAGNSAAHGTRVMVGSTQATKTVVLDGGQSVAVTLDGSFVALACASLVASFTDPATDILRKPINGFDTIEVMGKDQISLLGNAQILYVKGSPTAGYTWGEDYTVDPTKGFNRIQLMTQRMYVTAVVNKDMEVLIGITPASGSAAKSLIAGNLGTILRGLLGRGLIGQYQDANKNDRPFDPAKDLLVFQDTVDDTLFYYSYAWYSRNVIKRLFGLYALNNNDFSTGVVGN